MNQISSKDISIPCDKKWDSFNSTTSSSIRFCDECHKNVHNVSGLTKDKVHKLYLENNEELCISVDLKSEPHVIPIKAKLPNRISLLKAGIVVIGMLLTPQVIAQNSPESSFSITQEESISNTIKLEGKIVGLKKSSKKRIKNAQIIIYNEKTGIIGSCITNKKGEFTIELERADMSTSFHVSVNAFGYQQLQTVDLETKNTKFEIQLASLQSNGTGNIISGRYL